MSNMMQETNQLLSLAKHHLATNDPQKASQLLTSLIAKDPLQSEAYILQGEAFLQLKQLDAAIAAFKRALILNPCLMDIRNKLGTLLLIEGQTHEAERFLQRAEEKHSTAPIINAAIAPAMPAKADIQHVEWINPLELLHPGRMDIAVKFLYAKSLLGLPTQQSNISPKDMYLRHILFRTGGAEPGDEARKGNLDAFLTQFFQLIKSMQMQGFDATQPIPVSRRTGIILNGAHRLAAAIALDLPQIPVTYRDDVDGLRWDFDWFLQQGFAPIEIDEIVRTWLAMRKEKAGCVILWPTVEKQWETMTNQIQTKAPIASSLTIELSRTAFDELVRDIYATDWGPVPGENIERKVTFFQNFPPRLQLLTVATNDATTLSQLKATLRQHYHHIVPADYFATLHTTDSVRETAYIADILLNRANLAALNKRPAVFRSEFLTWLSQYHAILQRLGIDPEECCVVGSGALEAYNIREATDLDFTLTHHLRKKHFTPGVTHLTNDLDVVSQNYPRVILRGSAPTDNDLIHNKALHVRVRGLKFASLDIVLTRKQTQRRPKDLMDIELATKASYLVKSLS